jgi:uncharacterized delta-60 repeat protein
MSVNVAIRRNPGSDTTICQEFGMRKHWNATAAFALLLLSGNGWAGSVSDSGALDATFGSAGKDQLTLAVPSSTDYRANDVAVQPDGKIVLAGTASNSSGDAWLIARLNANGALDTTFNANGGMPGYQYPFSNESASTQAFAVAVRPNGKIIVAGTLLSPFVSNIYTAILIVQLNPDGSFDNTFATQGRFEIEPARTDSVTVSRIRLEADGSIDLAGTYYDNLGNFNGNQFFFARVAADGSSDQTFAYEFGSGPNQDDHALDVAQDNQGRYVVVGYHRGPAGNYDCAAIRIRANLSDVDNTFGSGGQTTVAFDLGGDNGDYCTSVAVFQSSNYIALGGYSTAPAGNGTYQTATLAMLDDSGHLFQTDCVNVCHPVKNAFAFGSNPAQGTTNAVTRLVIDDYNTKYPQLLALGWGYQPGVPYGVMFGVARFDLPSVGSFVPDTTFAGDGAEGIYFAERPNGIGGLTTTNYANSGAFANGKVVLAGYTLGSGQQVAVTRLQAFDGIFSNGFDIPSY